MDLNRKILKLGLILIGIILVISFIFVFSIELDNPVFLKTYMEERFLVSNSIDRDRIHQEVTFPISYIKNISDKRKIQRVEFPAHKDIQFRMSEDGWFFHREETLGIYEVKTVAIELYANTLPEEFDKLEFNKAKVIFNNGDTLDVDLGKLVIYSKNIDEKYIEQGSSSSSSDGTSSYTGKVMRDLTLEKLESSLFKEAKGFYEIKVNGKDYRDISDIYLKEGAILKVESIFKTPNDIINRYNQFEMQPKLIFKTPDGREDSINIYNIDYRPYDFNFFGIIKYLKARGEI